jgi:hypothetical protein
LKNLYRERIMAVPRRRARSKERGRVKGSKRRRVKGREVRGGGVREQTCPPLVTGITVLTLSAGDTRQSLVTWTQQ